MEKRLSKQHIHPREGLPRLMEKLMRKELVTVAFLGGSITEGYGASDPDKTSWRALTERYFMEKHPDMLWSFVNAGVGGTNSSFGAHRLRRHVFLDGAVDLLFVEFAVNDGQKRLRSPEGAAETIRGMEGIVRQCRTLSPSADIVLLYSADADNMAESEPFFIAAHEKVASHYGLPSVSFVGGVREWMEKGGAWESLAPDGVHPNDSGYAFYAALLCEFLDLALGAVEERPLEGETTVKWGGRSRVLPAPLREDNYDRASMLSAIEASMTVGMDWSGRPADTVNWRYSAGHWAADGEGGTIAFETKGRGAGLLLLCGPDTGIFEYSVNGEPFREYDPFDEWCPLFYRPVMIPLVSFGGESNIRIVARSTSRRNGCSKGFGFRVLGLLRH
ncbi:SGNH/GDSL hydrolase family protein [Cohnella soli]|uniref:SGNH/GDSL hydrolase family protein n=1 Tax=Cohnella soli TaxID=425005 RepID=A0ABW0HQ88_9BACL